MTITTTQTQTAVHRRWSEIPAERIGSLIARRFITGERMTVAHFDLTRGASVQQHTHEPEEMFCVIKGSAKVTINGEEFIVRAGELMQIPSGVPHQMEALEDAEVLDIFSPIRQDWLNKTDSYYQR